MSEIQSEPTSTETEIREEQLAEIRVARRAGYAALCDEVWGLATQSMLQDGTL